ncbi:hypothetical protein GWN63_01305, partial [Candidatus Bathyarchaeota archaeon]|nr:3'-5' exonuclease [Candidatus Bathyarchaeota archaeon]NIR17064.1 3'-5' exonuclease [Desulfobacterales bacterium]NIU80874.1 hypothetical protein [Candidatus Bathyarchaeota archaeon]NIV68064.1 hypothetical protein [Candidatus Bathyarchaeota archaeon]NIW33954.1 hypothetical protein [Candidatus Bathyarchaeota archaeon]
LVALDVETTGLSPIEERIAEIAFCEFDLSSRSFGEPESYLINDGVPMSEKASAINGITQDMLEGQPSFGELLGEFQERWVRPDT